MEIREYIQSLQILSKNLDKKVRSIIKKKEGYILGQVKLRLFNKGIDGSGSLIDPQYAPQTIQIKKAKGQRTSHVTLRDSGDLYRSLFLVFENQHLYVDTNLFYKKDLIERYGIEIFELTIQEITNIIFTIIEPEIQKLISDNDIDLHVV